jgi:peptidoglycan-associated lipoprotein
MKIEKTIFKNIVLVILLGLLISFGCAKKQITQGSGTIPTSTTSQQQTTSPSTPTPQTTPSSQATSLSPQTSQGQTTLVASGVKQASHFDNAQIYFDFDQYNLRSTAIEKLQKKAEWLRDHPEAALLIEGHCDERGTNEYNLALGERRADTALKYLMSLGIVPQRISTVSYGEERPADPGHNEEAWSKNRRDEFYLKK